MKRGFILILTFIFIVIQAQAFELILPSEKKSIVNSNYAFFVGHTSGSEGIKINDESVYVAPNGAFAHSVKLNEGKNRILVRTDYGVQVYNFYKNTFINQEFTTEEFDIQKAVVNCDNTPLRSTPIDAGLNRMGHLFEGTKLLINGANGQFYRVFLSEDKIGWIMKKDVTVIDEDDCPQTEFIDMKTKKYKNAVTQTIEFTGKLPYTLEDKKNEIVLRIYNPEKSKDSVYNLAVPKPEKYTYNLKLEGGKYTFKIRELPKKAEDLTIVVDAGHGGYERGAIGCLGDEEKDINLKIAENLSSILQTKGANVFMTRECDGYVSLEDRVRFAKEHDADIFVSIHLNSIGDIPMDIHKNRGTSVFYFNDNAKKLAEHIEHSTSSSIKTRKDGVKAASFAVIRPTDYIGVLVETAYMTNPIDSVLYRADDFPKKAAEGICEGILKFIKE